MASSRSCLTPAQQIAGWSVARKAAQLVAIPSYNFNIDQLGAPLAAGAGGVLLIGSAPAPANLASRIRAAAALAPPGVPPVVMADEEGGGVQRLEDLVGSIPWPRQMAAADTPAAVSALAAEVARKMKAAGVSMDLAPVLDVDGGAGPMATDADGQRSFGAVPATVTRYGNAFIEGLEAGGVIPVAKHFPGLGGASANTDYGAASTLPLTTLQTRALPPFAAAVAGGIPAVMVANASVPGVSSGPASLSSAVIGGMLRGDLHFTGLVLTDSVSGGAIAAAGFSVPAAAVAAIGAGADLVLFGSTVTAAETALLSPAGVAASFEAIVSAISAAVGTGMLPMSRLDAAAADVLSAKASLLPACVTAAP
ncbi:MAG TPA: glycoside hydrolase family 3 N-terminal domain-containing protein [Actinomycetota bacterium]|nr:glycoside hydrolase family 3 N-terminal domain-containing protein [Actinomycetota bacterium]